MPPASHPVRILISAPLNLGPGKIRLLEQIRDTGSISGAARQLRISYRRAWLMADALNRAFPGPLIETMAGGSRGGGARLSPLGEEVVARYRAMLAKAQEAVTGEANWFEGLAGTDPRRS
jgi:molybdate transport system regulatory protein